MVGIGFFELLIIAACGLPCIAIPIVVVVILATKKNKNSNED